MKGNLLIAHGGGPSPVLNASLYGAVIEAFDHQLQVGKIFGALGGTAGILEEKFLDFFSVAPSKLELLKQTPATSIGTSRTHLEPEDYDHMVEICRRHDIRYVLFNGGNGSMDTCGKFYKAAQAAGADIRVVGIPKTIDNDISITDHCPGYGSAARYIAQTVADISQDVRAMPIHVCIVEAMGRDAGWITAAAALAKKDHEAGPHMLLLPEVPFDQEKFLTRVEQLHNQYGGVVVVASEGLKNKDGSPIAGVAYEVGRSVYFGEVGAYLAQMVIQRLGIKARSEKPGIAGRASCLCQSSVDRDEAVLAGAEACRAALEGASGIMIGFERLSTQPYQIRTIRIPIEEVMLHERMMPKEFMAEDGMGVTEAFCDWCAPLIGGPLQEFVWLNY